MVGLANVAAPLAYRGHGAENVDGIALDGRCRFCSRDICPPAGGGCGRGFRGSLGRPRRWCSIAILLNRIGFSIKTDKRSTSMSSSRFSD